MGRPPVPAGKRRNKISISPDPEILSWLDGQTGLGLRWKDRTHAFEWCVVKAMREETGKAPR